MNITKELQTECMNYLKSRTKNIKNITRDEFRLLVKEIYKNEKNLERKEFWKRFFYANQLNLHNSKKKSIAEIEGLKDINELWQLIEAINVNVDDVFQFMFLPIGDKDIQPYINNLEASIENFIKK